jgi:hypothetical protein
MAFTLKIAAIALMKLSFPKALVFIRTLLNLLCKNVDDQLEDL